MEFFKSNTQIPFMRQQKIAGIFSAIIIIASIVIISIYGLNLGLDFTGGNQLDVKFVKPVDVQLVRETLEKSGFPQAEVSKYNTKQLSVRVGLHPEMSTAALKLKLINALPADIDSSSFQSIGASVGKQLWSNGILAIVVSLIGTMLYIAIRFEYRFALSAAVALIHDPLLIFGIFSLFHIEFNMIGLTAVLTVIGYSLNDTIVVYDRVRENFRKVRKKTPSEVMDLSINQTLSRTIMTSGLTMLVVIALLFWGGPEVHNFSIALAIGIVIGTYSSIYVAGSMAIALGLTPGNLIASQKKFDDGMP
ncbi:MAG: protein translocase subunit SecF [Coxiella sp. (in: Bacteria)]|nr:MAG: protein translocase subunit SecF [Coxiella sp. (in: g-proteobacteria)]